MDSNFIFNSIYINGMQIEENFGKYSISCKVGNLCNFDINQVSNQPHFHNCYELCIVASGEGNFIYKDKIYKITQGDIFIADPNVTHEVQVNKLQNLQVIFFFIEIANKENLTPKTSEDHIINSFSLNHKVVVSSQKHLLAYLMFIENYYLAKKTKGLGIHVALKSLILESLDSLSIKGDSLSMSKLFLHSALELALDYIDRHLNEKIKISDIATHSCCSVRNLQHLFKKHLNTTIIDYINERKIILASHYLMRQYSVNDTSIQVGINDPSQFTRLFKRYKSITPKKYQQLNISKTRSFGRRQQIDISANNL